ncbi:MAG: molybdopterin dinucleotide binding domain-containing protein, partial [Acidimicrobiia bacterium]|nr:molybdopterin dinucleotide binding domain-containing protein [Acidimicrobiia bacterium]
PRTYEAFVDALRGTYASYTPEWAAEESGVSVDQVIAVAKEIADAGHRFASHTWRATGSGNLGGWQAARTLQFLHVLTGSVGTKGGLSPNGWVKFKPDHWNMPPPHSRWNELLWPIEYPLAHHEMSILLPHLLKQGRGKVDVYFTRVYNPVWTNPDGFSWLEVLTDEEKVGLHVALTPTWSETAWYADYVLPMGVSAERHDTHSYETHAARWLGFRQPVLRVAGERAGNSYGRTYEANPGEVWEENEFWIDLSWRIDPDGSLGIRRFYESPSDPGRPVTVDEYYGWMFDHSVPGLPEAAGAEGLTPLDYMRKYGAFEIDKDRYHLNEQPAEEGDPGVDLGGERVTGFATPSRRLEFYSPTLADWGWEDSAVPTYLKSHVYWRDLDLAGDERILLPIFRLPTLIHTRSGNAKYLYEISHGHPLWVNPRDADALGFETGAMVRVTTDIGYFVMRAWRTEGIRPGVVAASHHLGRWRLDEDKGNERWSSALVDLERGDDGWLLRQKSGIEPFESEDPDSSRIWWRDAGVNQNLAFPVHPDPVSGMHAWHQRVRLTPASPGDRYGDIFVDTDRAHEIYKEWIGLTRPGPGPGNLRRPRWLGRPLTPAPDAYEV